MTRPELFGAVYIGTRQAVDSKAVKADQEWTMAVFQTPENSCMATPLSCWLDRTLESHHQTIIELPAPAARSKIWFTACD
jgi:hypothetical protein